jgi:hypothetical protein
MTRLDLGKSCKKLCCNLPSIECCQKLSTTVAPNLGIVFFTCLSLSLSSLVILCCACFNRNEACGVTSYVTMSPWVNQHTHSSGTMVKKSTQNSFNLLLKYYKYSMLELKIRALESKSNISWV